MENENLAWLSDFNIIVENFPIFRTALDDGVPVERVSSKESVKWRKLGLVYYSRSKQRYYLTQYSEGILKAVLSGVNPFKGSLTL
jgi:hypothetical protein